MKGKIIKGIAGFYYVHAQEEEIGIIECKAKGIFRKDHTKPLVGDDVVLEVLDAEKKLGNITEILPRRSELIRPSVANVDQALIVFAAAKPQPSFNLLDRLLIQMEQQNLPCIICFNKGDLVTEEDMENIRDIYKDCGCRLLFISVEQKSGTEDLHKLLEGKTTAVAGPSGVGKSSLINYLTGRSLMETGSISEKVERGKHTTRHSEIFALGKNSYICDTPGFSSLEVFHMEKEELAVFYPEFEPYEKFCKFGGCSHITEPVCGIRDAVAEGEISPIRYENYKLLYEELKGKKKW